MSMDRPHEHSLSGRVHIFVCGKMANAHGRVHGFVLILNALELKVRNFKLLGWMKAVGTVLVYRVLVWSVAKTKLYNNSRE